MSERYWISGVQLGMLIALEDDYEREKLVEEIIDKQFLGSTKEINKLKSKREYWENKYKRLEERK